MPGLFGYVDPNDRPRGDNILKKMRGLLVYANADGCKREPFYHDCGVHAGYCAPGFETADAHTVETGGVACWFDGEIYNTDELKPRPPASSPPAPPNSGNIKDILISAYKSGALTDMLRKIDGYFSAVIYDREKSQLKLIIDRYGFRHLFYTRYGNKFSWASECKAFAGLPDFRIDVNKQSVGDFMKNGFLCEDRTWLDGVSLLDPATVLTYDMRSGTIQTERYWSPEEIHPFAGRFDINEYCEEWGRLFKLAVAKRAGGVERAGLTLSGGLDSRAILAAMPLDGSRINAVTFGEKKCDDVRFAAAAAKLKGANHRIFPLEKDGWIERAFLGVWAADGAVSLSAQTGIEHLNACSKLFEANQIGVGGGIMQGGMEPGAVIYDKTESGVAGLHFRNRRMIRSGFRLDESYFKIRMPYYDNALYDFVMTVPRDIRQKGFLINKALLHNFPRYYKNIPWQKTGVPISYPPLLIKTGALFNSAASRAKRKLRLYGLPLFDSKPFYNLSEMLNFEKNRIQTENILSDKNAIYPQYIQPEDLTVHSIHRYANLNIEKKCRILAFEIWMRQMNNPGDIYLRK